MAPSPAVILAPAAWRMLGPEIIEPQRGGLDEGEQGNEGDGREANGKLEEEKGKERWKKEWKEKWMEGKRQ